MGIIAMRVRIDLRDTSIIEGKKSNVNQRELERERERKRKSERMRRREGITLISHNIHVVISM